MISVFWVLGRLGLLGLGLGLPIYQRRFTSALPLRIDDLRFTAPLSLRMPVLRFWSVLCGFSSKRQVNRKAPGKLEKTFWFTPVISPPGKISHLPSVVISSQKPPTDPMASRGFLPAIFIV